AEQVDRHAVCVVRVAHQGGVANDLASGRITDGVHGLVEAVGTRVVDQAYFVLVVAVLVVAVNHPAAKEAIIDFLFETNGDGLRGVGGRHARAGQVGGVVLALEHKGIQTFSIHDVLDVLRQEGVARVDAAGPAAVHYRGNTRGVGLVAGGDALDVDLQ